MKEVQVNPIGDMRLEDPKIRERTKQLRVWLCQEMFLIHLQFEQGLKEHGEAVHVLLKRKSDVDDRVEEYLTQLCELLAEV